MAPAKSRPVPDDICAELDLAEGKVGTPAERAGKKNFAQALSTALAQKFADALRRRFPEILPDAEGRQHESRARTSKGYKRLDVNYSTAKLGLALGVSIKTLNFRDAGSDRYTKNYTRIDNELRAEADDYHERQPYSVLVAVIFLPADACDDGRRGNPSSFGHAVKTFRFRARRERASDSPSLFEAIYIGLYEPSGPNRGEVRFFNVELAPPRTGRPDPSKLISFSELVRNIEQIYDRRNPPFRFEGEETIEE
ncbi:MAG: hypothetical protein IRZ04_21035 [Rhodospirillales bacterium]|nr:hypothetical protein [Rhodospirillales bacterium]